MPEKQYSSFLIARLLNVSRQAVNQWIDKGYIASYRTPGGHRRVAARDLLTFLRSRGIPLPAELSRLDPVPVKSAEPPSSTVFWLDADETFLERHIAPLRHRSPALVIRAFPNPYDLLLALVDPLPDLLVLSVNPGHSNDLQLIDALHQNPRIAAIPRILIVAEDLLGRAEELWERRGDVVRARNQSSELAEALIDSLQPPPAEVYS